MFLSFCYLFSAVLFYRKRLFGKPAKTAFAKGFQWIPGRFTDIFFNICIIYTKRFFVKKNLLYSFCIVAFGHYAQNA